MQGPRSPSQRTHRGRAIRYESYVLWGIPCRVGTVDRSVRKRRSIPPPTLANTRRDEACRDPELLLHGLPHPPSVLPHVTKTAEVRPYSMALPCQLPASSLAYDIAASELPPQLTNARAQPDMLCCVACDSIGGREGATQHARSSVTSARRMMPCVLAAMGVLPPSPASALAWRTRH